MDILVIVLIVLTFPYYFIHLFAHWLILKTAWGRRVTLAALENDPESRERLYKILKEESARQKKHQPKPSRR